MRLTKPGYRRFAASVAVAALVVAAPAQLFGARGAAAGLASALLWLAWRHDNRTGTCLPLAILFLIVLGVMFTLFALMMVTHAG